MSFTSKTIKIRNISPSNCHTVPYSLAPFAEDSSKDRSDQPGPPSACVDGIPKRTTSMAIDLRSAPSGGQGRATREDMRLDTICSQHQASRNSGSGWAMQQTLEGFAFWVVESNIRHCAPWDEVGPPVVTGNNTCCPFRMEVPSSAW